jgi:hypothetical protein
MYELPVGTTIFHTNSAGVCILRIHTTFHQTSSNVSLDITVERKGKCACPIPAQVLLHPTTYIDLPVELTLPIIHLTGDGPC